MNRIEFDMSVRPSIVIKDRQRMDVKHLDINGLRCLANGKIFITIEKKREFIVIESEVLDYLMQLKTVVDEIDSGNHKIVTVSGDYYSNNLRFTYDPRIKSLEIYEVNGARFKIEVPYKEFRSALLHFYKLALTDIGMLYPELKENEEYRKLIK